MICSLGVLVLAVVVFLTLRVEHYHASNHAFYAELSSRRGALINTTHGVTHVVQLGNLSAIDAETCLLLHGISTSSFTLTLLANELVRATHARMFYLN